MRYGARRMILSLIAAVFATALVSGPGPRPVRAQSQSDVVEAARSLCAQARDIWDSQDQWAISQLSRIYNDLTSQMSSDEYDTAVRTMYAAWTPAFGTDQPCDKDVLTYAARSGITRTVWDTFTRCLQTGIDARKSSVETFVRENQNLVQNSMVGTYNVTMEDSSHDYLISIARGAGLRACHP